MGRHLRPLCGIYTVTETLGLSAITMPENLAGEVAIRLEGMRLSHHYSRIRIRIRASDLLNGYDEDDSFFSTQNTGSGTLWL